MPLKHRMIRPTNPAMQVVQRHVWTVLLPVQSRCCYFHRRSLRKSDTCISFARSVAGWRPAPQASPPEAPQWPKYVQNCVLLLALSIESWNPHLSAASSCRSLSPAAANVSKAGSLPNPTLQCPAMRQSLLGESLQCETIDWDNACFQAPRRQSHQWSRHHQSRM